MIIAALFSPAAGFEASSRQLMPRFRRRRLSQPDAAGSPIRRRRLRRLRRQARLSGSSRLLSIFFAAMPLRRETPLSSGAAVFKMAAA